MINNALCKKEVTGIKMKLHRELRAKAHDHSGKEMSYEVDSVVMKQTFKCKVGAKCHDAIPFDVVFRMSNNVKETVASSC
jgi:hypothetical protein